MKTTTFARNRAEEYGLDIWQDFVIPPYFNNLSLLQTRKPIMIIGGRGCGKTMLLRYLCFETQFSPHRETFEIDSLNKIGLYWKIDTQFAKIMAKRGENEDDWANVFTHMGVLELSLNVVSSIYRLKDSKIRLNHVEDLLNITFEELKGFDDNIPCDIQEFNKYLKYSLQKLQTWIGNPKTTPRPICLPLSFLKDLINTIKKQASCFENSDFFVYIDEYENLLPIQKKVVNTWIKHSETPLIFNVAMKRNALDVIETIGNESIVDIHDYRIFDIEEVLDKYHDIFACEIFFLRLKQSGFDKIVPIDVDNLFIIDDSIIESRKSKEYEQIVTSKVKEIFPGYSQKELASKVVGDEKMLNRLKSIIQEALTKRSSKYEVEDFIDVSLPEASIVNLALLNRERTQIDDLYKEFLLLKDGKSNKYTGSTNWIHNNTIGCILYLYSKLGRLCPFYAGFDAFSSMSKGNIRHFLELCFQSIANCGESFNKNNTVSIKEQTAAAKQVSTNMLNEVKSLGNKGSALFTFVVRLGTIFEYCRDNLAQSEPEQNHFSIRDNISQESEDFIAELIKWSVLYEDRVTKSKSKEFGIEYILNPIYSHYFSISYRKKRRIILTDNEFKTIAFKPLSDFEKIISRFKKDDGNSPSLFDLF